MDKTTAVTDEEIIEAINEWPVTDNFEDMYTSPTSRVHNPASVSSFFLRNVGKVKKVCINFYYQLVTSRHCSTLLKVYDRGNFMYCHGHQLASTTHYQILSY
jgi:hypothetical protein